MGCWKKWTKRTSLPLWCPAEKNWKSWCLVFLANKKRTAKNQKRIEEAKTVEEKPQNKKRTYQTYHQRDLLRFWQATSFAFFVEPAAARKRKSPRQPKRECLLYHRHARPQRQGEEGRTNRTLQGMEWWKRDDEANQQEHDFALCREVWLD